MPGRDFQKQEKPVRSKIQFDMSQRSPGNSSFTDVLPVPEGSLHPTVMTLKWYALAFHFISHHLHSTFHKSNGEILRKHIYTLKYFIYFLDRCIPRIMFFFFFQSKITWIHISMGNDTALITSSDLVLASCNRSFHF